MKLVRQNRRIGGLSAKLFLAVALYLLPGTVAKADFFRCDEDIWCNRAYGCFGTGWAYADCYIWCYENGGQTLVGWADCYILPQG